MSINKASVEAVIGSTGTGKGFYIKSKMASNPGDVMVWAPTEATDNYREVTGGKVYRDILSLAKAVKAGERRVILHPPLQGRKEMERDFDRFCRIALALKNIRVHVEEASQVTKPGWSPPAWQLMSTAGRHDGMSVSAATQRPALIDKTYLSNCTEIRCFGLGFESDAKTMAGILRVKWGDIMDLQEGEYFHYLRATRRSEKGKIIFPKKKISFASAAKTGK